MLCKVLSSFDYLTNEDSLRKEEELKSKHMKLQGFFKSGYVEEKKKCISGDIRAAMANSTKIAEVKELTCFKNHFTCKIYHTNSIK